MSDVIIQRYAFARVAYHYAEGQIMSASEVRDSSPLARIIEECTSDSQTSKLVIESFVGCKACGHSAHSDLVFERLPGFDENRPSEWWCSLCPVSGIPVVLHAPEADVEFVRHASAIETIKTVEDELVDYPEMFPTGSWAEPKAPDEWFPEVAGFQGKINMRFDGGTVEIVGSNPKFEEHQLLVWYGNKDNLLRLDPDTSRISDVFAAMLTRREAGVSETEGL